jgi:hypothetical protein
MYSEVSFLLAFTILPVLFWALGRVLYAHWLVERHNQNTSPLKEFSSHPTHSDYFLAKTHTLSIRLTKSISKWIANVLSAIVMLSFKTIKILLTTGLTGLTIMQNLLKQKLSRK